MLYPRAGALGGCTAHNAMITVYPHNADWDGIAQLTGDDSWRADHMRGYFERLENCHHRPLYRWLGLLGVNPTRHGWRGWLQTEKAIPESALGDAGLVDTLLVSVDKVFDEVDVPHRSWRWLLQGQADPNDWRLVRDNAVGVCYPPLATRNQPSAQRQPRTGAGRDAAARHPDRLRVELDALATRVLFDENLRAVGVEYLKGAGLYRASGRVRNAPGERREARCSREVILAGGAFNSPQLLMLSGIGPAAHLQERGITPRVDLPGVGQNLQDRYEVGVVNRMNFKHWEVLKGAEFAPGDPQYKQWAEGRKGVYTTNGAVCWR
ncbi:GMC family oxidoreductase N-terminal domain-containing protein [Chromobacterium haemolyticum]|nr:GMC family oxidoreductase N-terminal domain-containing protein [Chromobacterium haemolyticum]